ncbi:MAG: hypothetical protein H6737_16465 [Alphaproteobacteria bacterium]|nr:hypothetical protein [Alphaproteobacteria bacterium]
MWITVAAALANPARHSAMLPGTEVVEAGHGHVGFRLAGALIEPFSMGGLSMGIAPFRRGWIDAEVLQSPEDPLLHVAQATARVTVVDTKPFALAVFAGGQWYEEAFQGGESAALAWSGGLALRAGTERYVDFSIAPGALLSLGPPGGTLLEPELVVTPYFFSAGWTRPFADRVSVRVGWPDGVTVKYRSERAWLDVSVLGVGVPIWGTVAAGVRF